VIFSTTEQAAQSDEFQVHLADLAGHFQVDLFAGSSCGSPLQVAKQKFGLFRQAIQRTRPDHIYVPYADGLTQIMGLTRLFNGDMFRPPIEAEGLLMRGGFAYPQTGWSGKIRSQASLALIGLSPWTWVHHLDPIPFEAIQRRGGRLAKGSKLMPEPVEPIQIMDHRTARQKLGIPQDGRYIGCSGALTQRKGIHLLVRAFANAKLGPNARLLLIGRIGSDVTQLVGDELDRGVQQGRIVLLNRYVSNEELDAGMSAMDVVCTPYIRHIGSSGIVVRAVAARRPVLSSDFGWGNMVTRRYGLGWTCNVMDKAGFSQTIQDSLDQAPQFQLSDAAIRFSQFHTSENYVAAWTARLRQRLGLAPAEQQRTWQWVQDALQP